MGKKAYLVETKLTCIEWFHSVLKSETILSFLHHIL